MKPVRATLLALLLAPLATAASAGEVTFTPFATYQWFDSQTIEEVTNSPLAPDLKDKAGYALALGYRFTPAWGLELNYGRTKTSTEATSFSPTSDDVRNTRMSLDGYYAFNADQAFSPYVLLGVGQNQLKGDGGDKIKDTLVNAAVGAFYRFNDMVALRFEARNVHNTDADLDDQVALIGVEFSPHDGATRSEAAPAPQPAAQEPAPVQQAAPIVAVMDSDKDGVADAQDSCASTPAGAKVDANGCPVDSDKDGVADYMDKCLDTKPGAAVDATGCYETLKQQVSIALDVKFASGKSEIQGDATSEIQKVADFMQKYPNVNVTIEGHTDNRGNAAVNKSLSQKRADAVKAELVKLGVDASRLTAVGYGSEHPIADNKTEAGRAQNRRVVASAQAQSESIKMKK